MIFVEKYRNLHVTLGAATSLLCAPAAANPVRASAPKSVDITVYNSGTSLVREERVIPLAKGTNHVEVPDIPATIDPTSLHFASITDPAGVRVLEQNYQYDLVNQSKLLEKYIGRDVEFVRVDPDKKKEYSVTGRLLSVGGGEGSLNRYGAPEEGSGMVAEIAGKLEVNPAGRLVLPSLPEGLILKPQLEWMLSSDKEGEQRAEIGYMANEISWSCDYVVLLGKNDDRINLKGWVTLVNHSGASFPNAGLKLVAGDVNMVRPRATRMMKTMAMEAAAAEPQFQQKELFEYKIYSLQRRTDVGNNESKQIELVSAANASARKLLVYDGMEGDWRDWSNGEGYRGQASFGQQSNTKVGVYLTFRNDEKSGLGMPLPKGRIRVYKKDEDGREQFIGEDQLDHTPKDEEVRLLLGNAFDLVGSRAQTDFKSLAFGRGAEETYQIKIRNHKKEAVDVAVYEHPWRSNQWSVEKSDAPAEKIDQSTLRFMIKVAPDKEKSLTYTVRYSW